MLMSELAIDAINGLLELEEMGDIEISIKDMQRTCRRIDSACIIDDKNNGEFSVTFSDGSKAEWH